MTIDWLHFSPLPSLLGGALIGAAAAWLALANGRIAGISGILGGLIDGPLRRQRPRVANDAGWRIAFLAGLVAAPWIYSAFATLPALQVDASHARLAAAGLMVGLGVRYGAGCTSGHGVCGTARGSRRSIVATACFMAAGFAAVVVLRHVVGG